MFTSAEDGNKMVALADSEHIIGFHNPVLNDRLECFVACARL